MIYVRWKKGEERRSRLFPPVGDERPDIAELECLGCEDQIGTDHSYKLVAIGPTDDGARASHEAGGWYAAGAAVMHSFCANDMTDEQLDELAADLVVITPGGDPDPQ